MCSQEKLRLLDSNVAKSWYLFQIAVCNCYLSFLCSSCSLHGTNLGIGKQNKQKLLYWEPVNVKGLLHTIVCNFNLDTFCSQPENSGIDQYKINEGVGVQLPLIVPV